jgi:hypothetical protein
MRNACYQLNVGWVRLRADRNMIHFLKGRRGHVGGNEIDPGDDCR